MIFPDISRDTPYLYMSRVPRMSHAIVYMPWGDTHRMTADQLRDYLRMLSPAVSENVVDFLWNFYSVYLNVETGRYFSLSRADLERAVSQGLPPVLEKQSAEAH